MSPLPLYLLSLVLFALGMTGAFLRRNVIAMALCLEVAFLGVLLGLAVFTAQNGSLRGVSAATVLLFIAPAQVLGIAAAAVGAYRKRGSIALDEFRELRG
jgi:NADH-quinone oxidoreductase subunit K